MSRNRSARSRKINLAVVLLPLLSVGFALLTFEIGLRITTGSERFLDPWSDTYWRTRLQNRTRIDVFGEESDLSYDSRLGWRMKPLHRNLGVNHNARGYRGRKEYTREPSGFRILGIGDSFTYGLGVRDDETYLAHVSTSAGVETINAAVNGYGAGQAILLWEFEGKQLSPDVLIFGYYVDDFYRNGLTIRDWIKPSFIVDEKNGKVRRRNVTIPTQKNVQAKLESEDKIRIRTLEFVEWSLNRIRVKLEMPYNRFEQLSLLNKYLLGRLEMSAKEAGVELLVLIFDHCNRGSLDYKYASQQIYADCKVLNLKCLDFTKLFSEKDYSSYYGKNCHLSRKGHEFVGQRISSEIKRYLARVVN